MHYQWKGRHITSAEHHADLERDSAAHEFGATRLDRDAAEEAAYANYKRTNHGAAAQHHIAALRAAMSQGQSKIAEQHAALYDLHMKAMGLRPGAMPPGDSIKPQDGKVDQFKPHPADQLLLKASAEKDRDSFFKNAQDTYDAVYLSEPDADPTLSKSLASPMSLDQLDGQRVRVYFNLHNRLFSVQHKGRVVAHVPEVSLEDVSFKVNESGRQRVLDEKRKNVHAFVEGTFNNKPEGAELLPQGVAYNPYKYDSFVRSHDKSPITSAKAAVLRNVPHPTITVQESPQQHAEPSWIHRKGNGRE